MNFDILKSTWNTSVAVHPDAIELRRFSADARTSAGRYERAARLRVICGSAAFTLALLMLIVLATLPHVWPGMRFALLLWSTSLVVSVIGLWRIRVNARPDMHASLADHLQAELRHIQREIAYHHSLRWRFWVPLGVGFVAAMSWQPPSPPGNHPMLLLGAAALWAWGVIDGPQHWPRRLQAQAESLQAMLDQPYADPATPADQGDAA